MSVKAKMKAAMKLWGEASKRAETSEGNFGDEWADGRYSVQITKANINESQSSGRLQASITYKGLEGEMKGKTIQSHDGLETEDNLMYFARKLKGAGMELPEDFDEIEDTLKILEKKKPKVRIRVKTNGEFQNVYIDKPIREEDVEDAEGSDETGDEDAVELEKGMTVEAKVDGETITGKVLKIDEDNETAVIKDEDGEKHTVDFDDIEIPEADEDEDEDDEDSDDDEDDEDEDEDDEPKKKKKASDDDDDDEDEDSDDDDEDSDEDEDEEAEPKVTKKTSKLKKKK